MTALYISSWDEAEEHGIDLTVDDDRCALGITCRPSRDVPPCWIGGSSDPPDEGGGFRGFYAITNPNDKAGELPVLACEDCVGWIEEALKP